MEDARYLGFQCFFFLDLCPKLLSQSALTELTITANHEEIVIMCMLHIVGD